MGKKKTKKYNYKKEVCEEIFFKILYDEDGFFKKTYEETDGFCCRYQPIFEEKIKRDYLSEQSMTGAHPDIYATYLKGKKNKKLLKKALSKTYMKPERLGTARCDAEIRAYLTPKCLRRVLIKYSYLIEKVLGGGQHDL